MLARPDDQLVPLEAAAALAAGIRDAQFRALPAGAHNMFDIFDLLGGQIVEFVRDTSTVAASERVLATVVFTDIVGSWLRPNPSRLLSSHRRSETKRGTSTVRALSHPRVSPNWRIRHSSAITREIPPRFVRTYTEPICRFSRPTSRETTPDPRWELQFLRSQITKITTDRLSTRSESRGHTDVNGLLAGVGSRFRLPIPFG